MHVGRVADPSVSNNEVPPATRLVGAIVAPVLVLGFLLLYLFPGATEDNFAWTIHPDMTVLLMGGGYASGVYFFARVGLSGMTGTPWRRVKQAFLPLTVFVTVMGLSTVLHWEKFNHGHPTFWAWAALYFLTPVILPALFWWNRSQDRGESDADEVVIGRPRRFALACVGAVLCLVAAALFFMPGRMMDIWPWALTELTARVVSGWFGLAGVVGFSLSTDARWSTWRITLETQAIGIAFLLLGAVRAWDDFDHGSPLTWAFVGSLAVGLTAIVTSYVRVEGLRRRGP